MIAVVLSYSLYPKALVPQVSPNALSPMYCPSHSGEIIYQMRSSLEAMKINSLKAQYFYWLMQFVSDQKGYFSPEKSIARNPINIFAMFSTVTNNTETCLRCILA